MSDRELLELAAEAAALPIEFDCEVNGWYANGREEDGDVAAWWNPLIDDGDALRLAVALHIGISMYSANLEVGAARWRHNGVCDSIQYRCFERYLPSGDKTAAARRAIVRAAAEIVKQIENNT
jgi:hypothetical protein